MATLILRSSCAPIKGQFGSYKNGKYSPTNPQIDNDNDSNANGRKHNHDILMESPSTPTAAVPGSVDTTNPRDGDQRESSAHSFDDHDSTKQDKTRKHHSDFHDKLSSLPLQCDMAIIPRISHSALPSTSRHETPPSNSDKKKERATLRVENQQFLPCGMDNHITLKNLPATAELSSGGGSASYFLSLTRCKVQWGDDSIVLLPIDAMPSTFQVSFSYDNNDSSSVWNEYDAEGFSDDVPRFGEVRVSFDFSTAAQWYAENQTKNDSEPDSSSCESKHENCFSQEWNGGNENNATSWDAKTTNRIERNPEINFLMVSLEEESQFLKKTLVCLGGVSFFFILAVGWTVWQIARKRRFRWNRVKKVFDASQHTNAIPYEVGTMKSGVYTASKENNGQFHIYPQHNIDARDKAVYQNQVMHEITPLQPRSRSSGAPTSRSIHQSPPSTAQSDENEKESSASPRHWYEDYLSPRTNFNKKGRVHRSSIDTGAREDVTCSLFSPVSKTSCKMAPFGANGYTKRSDERVVAITPVTSVFNKKLDFAKVTPVGKSQLESVPVKSIFSPHPCKVNLLQLSNHIESSGSNILKPVKKPTLGPENFVVVPDGMQSSASVFPSPLSVSKINSKEVPVKKFDFTSKSKQNNVLQATEVIESYGHVTPSSSPARSSNGSISSCQTQNSFNDELILKVQNRFSRSNNSDNVSSDGKNLSILPLESTECVPKNVVRNDSFGVQPDTESNIQADDSKQPESPRGSLDSALDDTVRLMSDDNTIEEDSDDESEVSSSDSGACEDAESESHDSRKDTTLNPVQSETRSMDSLNAAAPAPASHAKLSDQDMKRNLIMELQEKTRNRLSRLGEHTAAYTGMTGTPLAVEKKPIVPRNFIKRHISPVGFAEELAERASGKKTPLVNRSDDFASKLAKRASRKSLTPVNQDSSPMPASAGTSASGSSDESFLADYW